MTQADRIVVGATWAFQVATTPHGKSYKIIRPGTGQCRACGQPRGYPALGLRSKPRAFEMEVCRVAAATIPQLGGALIAVDVVSYIQRPKNLITRNRPREPILCPVTPDVANVLKCVEDALMRCRTCGQVRDSCRARGHQFTSTIDDDKTIVDSRTRKFYTAVLDVGAKIARPSRVVVTVTVKEIADAPDRGRGDQAILL